MKYSRGRNVHFFILTLICVTVTFTGAGETGALDKSDKTKLRIKEACVSCDLSGADLHSAPWMFGKNLQSINLSGADLRNANLQGAELYYADLRNANMIGAKNVDAAYVNGACLDGAIWIDGSICQAGSIGGCRRVPVNRSSNGL